MGSKPIFNPKFREIFFVHNFFRFYQIDLKFCTEHDSDTVVLYAKYQTDWTTDNGCYGGKTFCKIWV